MIRGFWVIPLVILALLTSLWAENVNNLKKGVVKISVSVDGKTRIGSGFIVNLKPGAAYIATASHVIEGATEVRVAFFTQPHRDFQAITIGLEGGDPRGMAVLLAEGFIPDDVIALDFDKYVTVKGGEEITSIGFPQMGAIPWAVTSGTIVGRQGRYITFTGAVDEGNSGGPLIKDGIVVGIITDILGLFNYAQPTATVQSALSGWRVRFSDKSDKRLLQGALDRFKHEQRLIVPLSEEQSSTLQRILKEYGEYWGQIYLGLIANDVGLIDTGIEASFEYIYLVLDITAQVWAGQNLNDRMLNKPAGDALKELVKIMLDEAGGTAHLDDQAISRIRQRVLKNKDIYIRDEFGRGGPRLRPIK